MKQPLRVLVFFPLNFLREKSGATFRFASNLQTMLQRGWRVELFSYSAPLCIWTRKDARAMAERGVGFHLYRPWLHPLDWGQSLGRLLLSRARGVPPPLNYKCPPSLIQAFGKKAREMDMIWLNWAFWAPLAPRWGPPVILDMHDYLTKNLLHKYGAAPGSLLRTYKPILRLEIAGYARCSAVLSISPREGRHLARHVKVPVIYLAPHAPPTFVPADREIEYQLVTVASRSHNNIAALDAFFLKIWLRLVRHSATIRMLVIGTVGEGLLPRHGSLPGLDFRNHLEDVTPAMNRSGLFLSVFSGGTGAKMKALEAWRHGLCVVGNRAGVGGYETLPQGTVAEDEEDALVEGILALLENSEARLKAESEARNHYLSHHSPASVMPVFEMLEKIAEPGD